MINLINVGLEKHLHVPSFTITYNNAHIATLSTTKQQTKLDHTDARDELEIIKW